MSPPPDERRIRPPDDASEPPVRPADSPPTEDVTPADSAPTVAMPDDAERGPAFSRDEVIAGRYRIVRFIARGGMGEVYEAEDLELGVHVALKTLRSDAEGRTEAAERFKREIQLARQVTHPNVCRIFDLVRHARSPAAGPGADVLCLTMELLAGETLLDRLRRRGAMSDGGGPADRRAGRGRARRRPPGRRHPSRLQESQRDAGAGRSRRRGQGRGHRLRPGPGLGGLDRRRRDRHRQDPGHARVHGSRADRRQARHRGGRHLRAGHRGLRDGHGPPAVLGRELVGPRRQAPDRAAGLAARPRPRPGPAVGGGDPRLSARRSRRALRFRRKTWPGRCAGRAW